MTLATSIKLVLAAWLLTAAATCSWHELHAAPAAGARDARAAADLDQDRNRS